MSIFSGKCDIYDSLIEICGVTDFSKVHIFVKNNPVELRIDSYKDLIPYFPCLTGVSTNHDGEHYIYTSGKPWYRTEEEEMFLIYLRDLTTCYNKLKREKRLSLEALIEMHTERFRWIDNKSELIDELAKRLFEAKGKKERVDYDDLYTPIGDHFRKRLLEEMIGHGWKLFDACMWCYGYRRAYEKYKEYGGKE